MFFTSDSKMGYEPCLKKRKFSIHELVLFLQTAAWQQHRAAAAWQQQSSDRSSRGSSSRPTAEVGTAAVVAAAVVTAVVAAAVVRRVSRQREGRMKHGRVHREQRRLPAMVRRRFKPACRLLPVLLLSASLAGPSVWSMAPSCRRINDSTRTHQPRGGNAETLAGPCVPRRQLRSWCHHHGRCATDLLLRHRNAPAQTLRGGCDSGTPPPLAEECRAPAQHTVGSNVVDNDWRGLRDEPPPSAGSVAAWQWACCVSGEEDDDGEHLVVERSEWWLRAFCCFFCGKWQLMKARRLARLEESQREQEAVHEIARLFSKVFAIDDGLDLGALLRGAQQGARLCLCVQSTNESFVAVYTYVSLYMCISRCV